MVKALIIFIHIILNYFISTSSELHTFSNESNSNKNCVSLDLVCEVIDELSRKVRSLEETAWKISNDNFRWSACSEGPCRCSPPTFLVNCWRMSLIALPSHQIIPKDTLTIDVGSNRIVALHRDSFSGLYKLSQLDISNNAIEYLPEHIFKGLENLKYLLLSMNKIRNLSPLMFKDLKYLTTLDLSDNYLTSLNSQHWIGLNSLSSLQLSRNKIKSWIFSEISPTIKILPLLQTLDISNNFISSLESQTLLPQLKNLKLEHNNIALIELQAFRGYEKLELLSLEGNHIVTFPPGVFSNQKLLEILNLAQNEITEIEESSFVGLANLLELNLRNNLLENLKNRTFSHMRKMERLILNRNNIENVESNAFESLDNLESLLLSNNMIEKFSHNTFINLTKINRLEIDSNVLQYLEENTLESLEKLKTIKLGKNAWSCECNILYLSNWIRDNSQKIFDYQPKCRGPGHLAGRHLHGMTFIDVCDGHWMSQQNIPARV